jgi:hypothetical protein
MFYGMMFMEKNFVGGGNSGIVFIFPRELTYAEAKIEIESYMKKVGGRKVYISELAEELKIDMDLIKEVLGGERS